MLESNQVFIFGYSGHAYVVIESLLEAGFKIKGYFDKEESIKNPYQLKYYGFERKLEIKSIIQNHLVFPTVGNNSARKYLVDLFDELSLKQFVAIDPSAKISKTSIIGVSSYVGKNSIINSQSVIGRGVIINTSAIVEHECTIKDYAHIAPNATLCGNVSIGLKSFVGANAVVKQNTLIASDVVIGAGSVIVNSIEKKGLWIGNPGKKK